MSNEGPTSPTVFGGRYELHRRLARGGMAEVFLARDQLLDRPVAVKVLFPEFATDPSFVERFRREAQAAANLSHPNIVSVYDWGQEGSTYYIVMEYVQGHSLSQIIKEEGPIAPARAAEIADDVASALGFAHKNDFVHRDMKSGNVMISPNGQVKVADFGIATAISGGAQANLTQTGAVMGTATYFSPEQAQGRPLDGRSDLYSLGVVLFEMLTGSTPFAGDNPVAIAYKHVQEPAPSVSSRRPEVPEALQAITAKLLAKDPDHRYPTAADLRADLRRFQAGHHSLAGTPSEPSGAEPVTTAVPPVVPVANPAAFATPRDRPPTATPGAGYPDADATRVNPVTAAPGGGEPPHRPDRYDDAFDAPDRRVWLWAGATVGLIALLIALIVVVINLSGGSDDPSDEVPVTLVRVPTLVPLDRLVAEQTLVENKLTVGEITFEENPDFPVDVVISQDPPAGTEVEEDSAVNLTVVKAPDAVPVPSVLGLTEAEALIQLAADGFENVEVVPGEGDENDELGIVLEQDPVADFELDPAERVTITVNEGPEAKEVPNLQGQTEGDAIAMLEELGWVVEVRRVNHADIPVGRVVGSNPSPGSELALGEAIRLRISQGPATIRVPSVLGDPQEEAAATITAEGLVPVPDECIIDDPDNQVPGTIIRQLPGGGIEVEAGSEVTLCVGVEPVPTPTSVPTATPPPPPTTVPPTPTP